MDYTLYEKMYGNMYHLLLNRVGTDKGIKYVRSNKSFGYLSVDNFPIFFNMHKEFCVALDYTIIYPKIYVAQSVKLSEYQVKSLSRSFIQ
jgi:hypothetical protein